MVSLKGRLLDLPPHLPRLANGRFVLRSDKGVPGLFHAPCHAARRVPAVVDVDLLGLACPSATALDDLHREALVVHGSRSPRLSCALKTFVFKARFCVDFLFFALAFHR